MRRHKAIKLKQPHVLSFSALIFSHDASSHETSTQPNHASPERRGGPGSTLDTGGRSILSPPGGGSPVSPGDDDGGLLEDEDGEELAMHSKAFYAIGRLKAIRQGPEDDRRR